jgi:hypothetical protein
VLVDGQHTAMNAKRLHARSHIEARNAHAEVPLVGRK